MNLEGDINDLISSSDNCARTCLRVDTLCAGGVFQRIVHFGIAAVIEWKVQHQRRFEIVDFLRHIEGRDDLHRRQA